ncbi:hypothetical protein SeF1_055 [Salmonella phage SeF1]|nr:hypothetical protein SeF1_055 [Salmonella phage SeF1]
MIHPLFSLTCNNSTLLLQVTQVPFYSFPSSLVR